MRYIVLTALICLAGCSHLVWIPTSHEGSQCSSKCISEGRSCKESPRAVVYGREVRKDCQIAENECLLSCPDLTVKRYYVDPSSDQDCWKLGYCDRGECVVRNGRCVRR